MGKLFRCITSDGYVSVSAALTTDIVSKAEQFHKTSAVTTAALGRLLTAASIMGEALKSDKGAVTLRIEGDGPAKSIVATSDSNGNVRGYVHNPIVEIPLNSVGKLDVKGAIGNGTLFVTKDIGYNNPYNGAIELVSGEIAEDIAAYFGTSEQIPTVCALGVLVNPDLSVKHAGGFIIQLLPNAPDSVIEKIEDGLKKITSVTSMLSEGLTMIDIVKKALSNFEVEVLEEKEIQYICTCSRERTTRILKSLGKSELERLANEQEKTQVNCHFCDIVYDFSSSELKNIANSIPNQTQPE